MSKKNAVFRPLRRLPGFRPVRESRHGTAGGAFPHDERTVPAVVRHMWYGCTSYGVRPYIKCGTSVLHLVYRRENGAFRALKGWFRREERRLAENGDEGAEARILQFADY